MWLQVALIDVNEALGNELKSTLDQEYGRDRAEFYTADVTSEEDFKGFPDLRCFNVWAWFHEARADMVYSATITLVTS